MAFDPVLATRIAAALGGERDVASKRMFGGIAWLVAGHMVCGIVGDDLVLRLGDAGAAKALQRAAVRPMDFTGRPLHSMVYVGPAGVRTERQLAAWLRRALDHARSLPPKQPKRRR